MVDAVSFKQGKLSSSLFLFYWFFVVLQFSQSVLFFPKSVSLLVFCGPPNEMNKLVNANILFISIKIFNGAM